MRWSCVQRQMTKVCHCMRVITTSQDIAGVLSGREIASILHGLGKTWGIGQTAPDAFAVAVAPGVAGESQKKTQSKNPRAEPSSSLSSSATGLSLPSASRSQLDPALLPLVGPLVKKSDRPDFGPLLKRFQVEIQGCTAGNVMVSACWECC